MKFTDKFAKRRAEQLCGDGTYVEGRYFGYRAAEAARFAQLLALRYERDVQIVERIVFPRGTFDAIRGRNALRKTAHVTVLATITGDGHVFT